MPCALVNFKCGLRRVFFLVPTTVPDSMKLVFLLIVAVAANAATLGSNKCGHGPSYWCETMIQAKECGAVQYCLDNHWPNIKTVVHGNADQCADCTNFIGDVKNLLSNATVEQMITDDLDKLCEYMGSYKDECKLLVATLVPEFVQKFNPKDICTDIGFCKGFFLGIENSVPAPPSNDDCSDCQAFLGDVKTLLSNATVQNMILQELKGICQSFGSLAPQCEDYISQYGRLVFNILLQYFVPKDVCVDMGFCKGSLVNLLPGAQPNVTCSDCKAFMGDIQKDLSDPATQKMIIDELNTFCNSLGSFAPQCQAYVSQYVPLVLDLLAQYFDPNVVCVDIGLCTAEGAPRKLRFTSNDLCSDCTTVVKDVEIFLENPNVQKAIISEVEKVCDDLGKVGPQCKQYVENYAPLLFELALQYLTPSTVCGALGLCSGKDADAIGRSLLLL